MKALVYTNPNEMTYQNAVEPVAADGELLVRLEAAGICGSDMHAYHGHDARRVPPLILGHEAVGIVVDGPRAGERVALNPLLTCGTCDYCLAERSNLCSNRKMLGMSRPGAMAELVTIPAEFVLSVSAETNPAHASLMEPTACVLHAVNLVERVAFRSLNECRIMVIGAGAIGLLTTLLLQHLGCTDIHLLDTNEGRRNSAETHTNASVHNPLNSDFQNEIDIVFDAVGSTITRHSAVQALRPGGIAMHIGLQEAAGEFDARKVTLDELIFLGTYTYTQTELRQSLALIETGALGDFAWVDARPLADGAAAFADLDAGRAAAAKIVLIP